MKTRFFFYPPPHATTDEALAWADKNGMQPRVLDRGPDGLTRGICEMDAELVREHFERKREVAQARKCGPQ